MTDWANETEDQIARDAWSESDVNVDPTEQLLARADTFEGAIVVSGEDEATRLVRQLAAALRATRTELETAHATAGNYRFAWETTREQRRAAEATLQQARIDIGTLHADLEATEATLQQALDLADIDLDAIAAGRWHEFATIDAWLAGARFMREELRDVLP